MRSSSQIRLATTLFAALLGSPIVTSAMDVQADTPRAAVHSIPEDPVAQHALAIMEQVKRSWLKPADVRQDLVCTTQATVGPKGDIEAVEIIQSSGDAVFDNSAAGAVYRASPLPVPADPALAGKFKVMQFRFTPQQ